MKNALTLLLLIAFAHNLSAALLDVRGEDDRFVNDGPYWADNDPVRIKIDPLLNGSVVDSTFTWNVYFDNFVYDAADATNLGEGQYANGKKQSQIGHTHYYATFLGDNSLDPSSEDFWNYTNVFGGASVEALIGDGILEFTTTLPVDGEWLIYVESQYSDHTSRIRPHPQYIGSWDAVIVTVESEPDIPEPSSLALIAAGGLMLIRRRR